MRSTTARVRVEAVGNVFFDVSDADFTIADQTPPVVTTSLVRAILYPPRGTFIPVGFTWAATDNCDPPGSLAAVLEVHSDEPDTGAPYTPDASVAPGTLHLRAERDYLQDGRVYLIVVKVTDTSGSTGFTARTVVVPKVATVASFTSAMMQATAARTYCLGPGGGAAPAGYTQLMP
jgi:hypothetical protein